MDIGRSFSYILEDEDWWKKVLIGGLLTLIPIVGPFYGIGYLLQAIKNVIAGREVPLPEALEDFGAKLVKGLLMSVIILIYALPLIIIGGCAGAGGASPSYVEDADVQQVLAVVSVVWSSCFGCLALLYGIFLGLLLPFVMATYADTGVFGDAFKLGDIFGMLKKNVGPAFIVLLVTWLASLAAGIAGGILCGIGVFATSFFAQLVMAYLYGTLYVEAKRSIV
jgi:hypothetical protein